MIEINTVKEFLWNQWECRFTDNHEINKKSLPKIFKVVQSCINAFNSLPVDQRKRKLPNMKIIKDRFNEILERECSNTTRAKNVYRSMFRIQELSVDLICFRSDVNFDKKIPKKEKVAPSSTQQKKKVNTVPLTQHDIEHRLCSFITDGIQTMTQLRHTSYTQVNYHEIYRNNICKHFVSGVIENLTTRIRGRAISLREIQSELLSEAHNQYRPINEIFTEEDMIHVKEEMELIKYHELMKHDFSYADYDRSILKENVAFLDSQERLNLDPEIQVNYSMVHYRLGSSKRDFTELLETIQRVMEEPIITVVVNQWNEEREHMGFPYPVD